MNQNVDPNAQAAAAGQGIPPGVNPNAPVAGNPGGAAPAATPGNAPSAAPGGATDFLTTKTLADLKQEQSDVVNALKGGIEAALDKTAANVPKLSQDLKDSAEALVSQIASKNPIVEGFIRSALGLVDAPLNAAIGQLDAKAVAELAWLHTRIDSFKVFG